MKLKFLSLLLAILLCAFSLCAFAGDNILNTDEICREFAEKGILSHREFAEFAGNSDWDWLALAAALNGDTGDNYLTGLANPKIRLSSATDIQRTAIVVYSLGGDPRRFCEKDLIAEGVLYRNGLGAQGANGYIWGLIALDANATPVPADALNTRESIIDGILEYRLECGAFSLNKQTPDTDVTAMALVALAKYVESPLVNDAVNNALDWLSHQQLKDGDFAAWGTPNAETTAQVIIALSALGVDVFTDVRFIKNGSTCFDGLCKYYINKEFAHIIGKDNEKLYNRLATAQGYCALAAINKGGNIFDFSGKELTPVLAVSPDQAEKDSGIKIKPIIVLASAVIGIALGAAVYIKWRRVRDLLIIVIVFAVICCFAAFANIQSVDEYYNENPDIITHGAESVTLCIRCTEAVGTDAFDALVKAELMPADGLILPSARLRLDKGDSVFELLQRAAKHYRIQLEFNGGIIDGNAYIEGINYLYELDCGASSGWLYRVNGDTPNYGISQYYPKNGDYIEIVYTLDYSI